MMGWARGTGAGWWRRAGRVVSVGVLAGLAVDTARLRRRAGRLRTLVDGPSPPGGGHRLLEAAGVRVDQATLNAARAHAHAHGLAALDLVPHDLPAAQALDLLRAVDPACYRADRLAAGRGACHAVLADETLLHTAGVASNGSPTAAELAAAVVQLKLHAPAGNDLAVAPRLRSCPDVAADGPQAAV
ncbi:MAG: class I SAM-dependent methyltransferase, partial [Egibacteraceae bacterium]